MPKYRARRCANCNYYVGYWLTRPVGKTNEVHVISFCLSCNYRLPMHTVLHGTRRGHSALGRRRLWLATRVRGDVGRLVEAQPRPEEIRIQIHPSEYARHLRAIGQNLETLGLKSFNLECTGQDYRVWTRVPFGAEIAASFLLPKQRRLFRSWLRRSQSQAQIAEERAAARPFRFNKPRRYSLSDIDRLEQEGRSLRPYRRRTLDSVSLSQALRAIGALVGRREQRLLAVCWHPLSVSVVVESAPGKMEIEIFRPDSLYDLWASMYLRRDNRALSDVIR